MTKSRSEENRQRTMRLVTVIRFGWPVAVLLAVLWFPFDWLSTVWPAFGNPFRLVFRNAHDHLIGHTVFFLLVGLLVLAYLPPLRRRPLWYVAGLALAALVQEAIQALFRGQAPSFTDFNAFTGDALGGLLAFALWWAFAVLAAAWRRRLARGDRAP